MLKILRPSLLIQAFDQAKWQEESNATMIKRSRVTARSTFTAEINKWEGNLHPKSNNQMKNDAPKATKKVEAPTTSLMKQLSKKSRLLFKRLPQCM
jgi:hypothetical protein